MEEQPHPRTEPDQQISKAGRGCLIAFLVGALVVVVFFIAVASSMKNLDFGNNCGCGVHRPVRPVDVVSDQGGPGRVAETCSGLIGMRDGHEMKGVDACEVPGFIV